MPPGQIIPLIAAVGPLLVNLAKKLFRTKKIQNEKARTFVHATLPLAVGVSAAVLNSAVMQSGDVNWPLAVLEGLSGGAGASYVRDFDKNVLGVAKSAVTLIERKKQ